MAPPHTMQLARRADWALMTAIHDALRRDLDQLLHGTASRAAARAHWATLRSQLRFHLAAEHAAMWPQVTAKLAGDRHGQVPAQTRLLYRTVWLPRYARTATAL